MTISVTTPVILEALYEAIDEMNDLLPLERRLPKSCDTRLFGEGGRLDSMGLVNLIVAVEQKIEEKFARTVVLADERAMSQRRSPFRSVAALAGYIETVFAERVND
jgi:acyl carrier protein